MNKILILILVFFPYLSGCSSWSELSLVHSPDIEQGNIITPEMVALLEPGMTQRQVRFALGTPMLIDVFHKQRWEYLFSVKRRNQPIEIKVFRVYFDGDEMTHYTGDIQPDEQISAPPEKQELLVSVPDYDGDLGILERLWYSLGFGEEN
jgi:outer membrane protein assembly factor BamE